MIQIREAKLEDIEGVLALAKDFPSPSPLDEDIFRKIWKQKQDDSNSYIGIAISNDMIVGYVSGFVHLAFYANGSTFWVDEIFVKEDLRRKGLGKDLMQSIELWVANRGCKLIALATNGAKEFYSELGFENSASYFKKYL